MIYQGRAGRRVANIARSQIALRLGLAVYAALCGALLLRSLVLMLGLPATVASVGAIIAVSEPIVLPLQVLPGAARVLVGAATLADITAATIILVAPLPFLGIRSLRSS